MTTPDTRYQPAVRTFTQRFSATRRGARLARLLAARQLADWGVPRGTATHDTAALVVAELTSNAALHGGASGRDFGLRLTHDRGTRVVRVEVSDSHPARPVQPYRFDRPDQLAAGEDGRGLLLVDALAACWGVRERSGPGKTVWAECRTESGSGR